MHRQAPKPPPEPHWALAAALQKGQGRGLGLPSGALTLSSQGLHTSLGRTLLAIRLSVPLPWSSSSRFCVAAELLGVYWGRLDSALETLFIWSSGGGCNLPMSFEPS